VPLEDTVTVWGKITITIRRDDLMPVRQVYFDERGEKKRVMEFSDVREMGGRLFPAVMEMKTLGKNSRTLIRYLSSSSIRNCPKIFFPSASCESETEDACLENCFP